MLKRFAVLAVLALSACAAPEAGDDCNQEGVGMCDSASTALLCESGTLRAIPCRGSGGCSQGDGRLTCDPSRAQAGDACPSVTANHAQCDASNPDRALKCTSGAWTAQACNDCAVQGGKIVCFQ